MNEVMLPMPRRRRSFWKATMHWLRRSHLYLGLFLFPWAILYGVTAFLFNHPTAFSDRDLVSFSSDAWIGTPMDSPPSPQELAIEVVAALQSREVDTGITYMLIEPEEADFGRGIAFVSVKNAQETLSILVYADGSGGRISTTPIVEAKLESEPAPFAVNHRMSSRGQAGNRGDTPAVERSTQKLEIDQSFPQRLKVATPIMLAQLGIARFEDAESWETVVTSTPELTFLMDRDGECWKVKYDTLSGSVSGIKASGEVVQEPITVRRFLTRLHLAHGYPTSFKVEFAWAVIVDSMSFVICFWGITGLLMWWQIKATRRLGVFVLLMSFSVAAGLGVSMYALLNG